MILRLLSDELHYQKNPNYKVEITKHTHLCFLQVFFTTYFDSTLRLRILGSLEYN